MSGKEKLVKQCKHVVQSIDTNFKIKQVTAYTTRNGLNFTISGENGTFFEIMPTHLLNDNDKGFYKVVKHVPTENQSKLFERTKCGFYHISNDRFGKVLDDT